MLAARPADPPLGRPAQPRQSREHFVCALVLGDLLKDEANSLGLSGIDL
jgi:hypothetical protein